MTYPPEPETSTVKKKAVRAGTAMVVGKVFNQFIGFAVVWIQAHYLSVWSYGVFGMFIGTIFYLAVLGSLGTPDIARRFLPEFAEKNHKSKIARTVRVLLIVRFLASAVFLILVLVFFDEIGGLLNIQDYKSVFAFFSIGILVAMEARLMSAVYWALLKHVKYQIIFTGYNLARLVLFYLVLKGGGGLVGALAVDSISYLLLFIGLYIPFAAKFDLSITENEQKTPIKRMARYGGFMYLGSIGHIFFNTSTDLYVISAFLNQVQLGYYAFAVNIGQAIVRWMPSKLVGSVVQSVAYRDFTRRGSPEALPDQFAKIISYEAFFAIPTAIFLLSFSGPLIGFVFDVKFLPSKQILSALGLVFCISSLRFPLDLVATSLEKVRLLLIVQIIFAIYNLVADIILIPILGLWGAVIATGSSMVFLIVSIWFFLSRSISLKVESRPLLKVLFNSILMGAFFIFINNRITNLMGFFIALLCGGIIYLITSYINWPYEIELRKKLIMRLKRK